MAEISIVVGLYNSLARLPKLIDSLQRQKNVPSFELLAIDTSSADNTTQYLRKIKNTLPFTLSIFSVKKVDFGHGKTRNLIIKSAQGKIIVFISDDIEILSSEWLSRLIKPLKKNKVAAVFGRQIPYRESSCYDHFFYQKAYPPEDRLISKKDLQNFSATNIFYSMANACARADLLRKYPFVENKDSSVDQWWAKKILENGYFIFYTVQAEVKHSHIYNLRGLVKRQFLSGQSLRGFFNTSGLSTLQTGLKYIQEETIYIRKNCSIKILLLLPLYEGVRISSFFLGKRFVSIPGFINRL